MKLKNSDWRILKDAFKQLRSLHTREKMTAAKWCDNHYMLPEQGTEGGRWKPFPYQRILLQLMGDDQIEQLVFRKSARVGYTATLMGYMLYEHVERRRRCILYLPDEKQAQAAMETMHSTVEEVPVAKKLLAGVKAMKVLSIQFLGSIMRILGGGSGKNYRQHNADTVIFDEVDGFDHNVDKEGSPITLGRNRNRMSPVRKSLIGSTPKNFGDSLMEQEEDSCDFFFRFCVKCPHCGEYEPYVFWGETESDKDVGLQYRIVENATNLDVFYRCGACYETYDETVKFKQIDNMVLRDFDVEKRGWTVEYNNGEFVTIEGEKIRKPNKMGLHLWTAYNPYEKWEDMCREHIRARRDSNTEAVFTNTYLGEYWDASQSELSLEAEPLLDVREEYEHAPLDSVICTTAGVDVQGNRLELTVISWGVGYESWVITHQVFMGDPVDNMVWNNMEKWIKQRQYPHHPEDHRTWINLVAVDCGYLNDYVYDFCRRKPKFYIAVRGSDDVFKNQDIIGVSEEGAKIGVILVRVGMNNLKELVLKSAASAGSESVGEMVGHFPKRAEIATSYFKQLTAEHKIMELVGGKYKYKWVNKRQRNETLDCFCYAWAGARLLEYLNKNINLGWEIEEK